MNLVIAVVSLVASLVTIGMWLKKEIIPNKSWSTLIYLSCLIGFICLSMIMSFKVQAKRDLKNKATEIVKNWPQYNHSQISTPQKKGFVTAAIDKLQENSYEMTEGYKRLIKIREDIDSIPLTDQNDISGSIRSKRINEGFIEAYTLVQMLAGERPY
ncbi:MAG: hypothetical protein QNL04_13990 [SAR324 cluster bacterium]|nr:hypothetical protein [SAR324 cluster bacterium]